MIATVTVAGTVANEWQGYPADTARAITDPALVARGQMLGKPEGLNWTWIPVRYPAATFPMRDSILVGWERVVDILLHEYTSGLFNFEGYSQGALVACLVLRHELLDPNGRLHHRLNDFRGVITWGNPMRSPGIAYGNKFAGWKVPGKVNGQVTGGIACADNLRPEECVYPVGHPWEGTAMVLDFANEGDLYTQCPCGETPWVTMPEVAKNQNLVFESVMDFNGKDMIAWAAKLYKIVSAPMTQVMALFQALWGGVSFLGKQLAPHNIYDYWPAVHYLTQIGKDP